MITQDRLKKILDQKFKVSFLKVTDDSHRHAGHAGVKGSEGGTHFTVVIVSKDFEGKSLINRHRLVYEALNAEFKSGLHAVAIKALTLEEFETYSLPGSE